MIAEACIGRRLSRRRPSSGGGPPVFSYPSSPGQERDSFPQSMPRGREVLDLLAAAVSNLSIATRSGRYWALRAAGREPRIDRVVAWPPVFDWLHRLPIVMRGPVRTMLPRRRLMRWSVRTRARLTDRGRLFLGMNADHLGSAQVTQDVLLMCGEHDSFQPPSPTRAQAKALTAARSVTVRMFTKPRTLINAGGVRQAIARCTRAGLTVTCHRVADLDDHTRELIKIKADQWRDGTVERGFSMALDRCGSPEDGCTVVAMSTDSHGELRGLLHFVPWGDDGLWLDLMRRDRTAENGVVEQLVAGVIRDATKLGITQVSLNFAVFCSVFARRRTARSRARSAALARRASQPVQVLADRVALPSQREVPARMGLPPASSASDPQPTYRESGSRHSGPVPSSSPPHGSSGSCVSDFITDRPDHAKHGGAGWPDFGVVRTSPAQRLLDPCSRSPDPQTRGRAQPPRE